MRRSTRNVTIVTLVMLAGALVANAAWFGSPRAPEPITAEPIPTATVTAPPSASTPIAPSPSSAPSPPPAVVRPSTLSPCRTPDRAPWRVGLAELRAGGVVADRAGNTFIAAGPPSYVGRASDKTSILAYGPGGALLFRAEGGDGRAAGIAVDKSDEALVIGTLRDEKAPSKVFVARFGPGGGLRKRVTVGEPGDEGKAIAVGSDGNIAVLLVGDHGAKVLSLDVSLGERWSKALGHGEVKATSLAIGADLHVIVGGAYRGTPDLGGGALPAPKYGSRGFVLALDEKGQHRFSKPISGPSETEGPTLVAAGPGGHIAVAAAEDGQPDGVVGYVQVTVMQSLDAAGAVRFERRLLHDTRPSSLVVGGAGDILVAGHFAGALELSGRVRLPSAGDGGGGFVVALDPRGDLRFAAPAGANDVSLAALPSGEVVIASGPYERESAFVTSFCPPSDPPGPGTAPQARVRSVRRRYALPRDQGHVELLLDARMKPGAEKEFGCFYWAGGAGPDFDSPPLGASLRWVDREGKVIDQIDDDHPMGIAEPTSLYGDDRVTFAFVVNDSPCVGKRRGRVTTYYEPIGGKLVALRDQHGALLSFTAALTGAARQVPARSGRGKDILKVRSLDSSGPDSKDGYVTLLVRYSFENGRWVSHEKRVPGEWQEGLEGAFPARADFP